MEKIFEIQVINFYLKKLNADTWYVWLFYLHLKINYFKDLKAVKMHIKYYNIYKLSSSILELLINTQLTNIKNDDKKFLQKKPHIYHLKSITKIKIVYSYGRGFGIKTCCHALETHHILGFATVNLIKSKCKNRISSSKSSIPNWRIRR